VLVVLEVLVRFLNLEDLFVVPMEDQEVVVHKTQMKYQVLLIHHILEAQVLNHLNQEIQELTAMVVMEEQV